MGVPVYRTASTVPQYTDISVYRYTPNSHVLSKKITVYLLLKWIYSKRIEGLTTALSKQSFEPLGPGPEVIKLFSCSTQLSMKFQLLINVEIINISGKFRCKTQKLVIYPANKC